MTKEIEYKTHSLDSDSKSGVALFENLPQLLRPSEVALLLRKSVSTVYDWKYRSKARGVPSNLFLKCNRTLYLRTEVLKQWLISQNPFLDGERKEL